MVAHARSADRDDAHPLVRPIAELFAQARALPEGLRMLADDIAGEIEMLRHPVAHRRQILAERQRHDVLGRADEDRPVAHAGMPLDVLDHLGVVVGGQERLVRAA